MSEDKKKITKKKSRRKVILILLLSVLLLSCATIGTLMYFSYQKMVSVVEVSNIYHNIFINDINVGGMTKNQALETLHNVIQIPLQNTVIEFKNNNSNYNLTFGDLNVAYNLNEAVQTAYEYARDGSIRQRYEKIMKLEQPIKITAGYNFDTEFIKAKISELESKVYIAPTNASMKKENGKFVVKDGRYGEKLNVDETLPDVIKLVEAKTGGTVELKMESVAPIYTAESFSNAKSLLGTFNTTVAGSAENRNENIINGAKKINNQVVYPGETFSTNKILSPFTYANGYRNAPIIVGGELVDGLGGGICQVSTTLYNAVLYSELPVVERQNHSLKVGYADYAYDATLAGDYIDFKFKNDTKYPILIECYINGNKLVTNIYGNETRSSNRKIVFENALVSTVQPPAENIIDSPDLPKGQREVVTKEKLGYKYSLYKIVYENGTQIEKVQINSSYYKPVRGVVKVGTKEISEQKNENSVENKTVASNTTTEVIQQDETTPQTENTTEDFVMPE